MQSRRRVHATSTPRDTRLGGGPTMATVFRRNDFGDGDVYYTQPDNSVRSEILVRQ